MILGTGESVARPFSRKSRYILVIESDTDDLFTTAMLLNRFSYPVCTARNARQALDMISVAMPELIVTDVDLPGMTGIELLRILASNHRTVSLPVILLHPSPETGQEKTGIEIGGSSWLKKPIVIEDFYCAVQSAMERTPRSNIRVRISLPVVVNKVALDGSRGECATQLSAQGVYIRTFKYHRPKDRVALQININDRTINTDGTVLYTQRQDDRPFVEPGMAIKFTRIMAEDREHIRQYVRDILTQGIVKEIV
jgi:DNA-binding response OmpR family regulator